MEQKKPIGITSGRLFCLFILLVSAIFAPFYFARELWFDEALTLQFALLDSPWEIYKSYTIPNNQIIHTIGLNWLLDLGCYPETARLFPLCCAVIMIWLMWKNFSREPGKNQLLIALGALIISPPFWLYASALRGYMLAAMFTVAALCAGKKYALGGKYRYLAIWFIMSFLTVGVMPSALAGIAAAGLYIAPYCGKKFWKNRKIYLLAAAALTGAVIFYLPIKNELFKAFELKEGWHHAGFALLATAIGAGVTFFVPLVAGAFFHRPQLRNWPRTLIWLLPLGGCLLPVAPFPRVWFVIFPVIALLCAGFLRRMPEKLLTLTMAAVLLWGALTLPEYTRKLLSPAVTQAGQDDFFAPRFARSSFTVRDTVQFIEKNSNGAPVFVSFDADPFAVFYAFNDKSRLIMDIPPGKRKILPDNTLVILGMEEDAAAFEKRFNASLYEIYHNDLHKVYYLRTNDNE